MTFEELLKEIDKTKLGQLSREDIEKFVEAQERVIHDLTRKVQSLNSKIDQKKQSFLELDGEYIVCKTEVTEVKAGDPGESTDEKKKKKEERDEKGSAALRKVPRG
jgi:hypothetical protein